MKDKRPHRSAITLIHKGLAANAFLPGFAKRRTNGCSRYGLEGGQFLRHYLGRMIYRTGPGRRTQTIEFGNLRLEHSDGEPFQTARRGE
jgi:hypothetical protein